MSSFSFCSRWAHDRESRFNWDSIYFIKLDFVLFCTLLRSFSLSEIQRWIVSLCDFLYVFFRVSFSYFSFIDCRFDHCEIIISHYFFSLTITMRWSWDDRRKEKESCWKKKSRLSCAVSCVCLWIQRKWKSRKFWKLWSNFDLRKENLTLFLTIRSSINLF
jgi:hypothetical protein